MPDRRASRHTSFVSAVGWLQGCIDTCAMGWENVGKSQPTQGSYWVAVPKWLHPLRPNSRTT
eukprot:COSAG01_NODE_4739_length_4782_cov_2.805467_9_plen_62_part_00